MYAYDWNYMLPSTCVAKLSVSDLGTLHFAALHIL